MIAFVARDLVERDILLGFYWYECHQRRQEVREELQRVESDICFLPLVPQRGFDNPNAISTDLVALLEHERPSVEGPAKRAAQHRGRIAIVLIARTSLREPLIGSAVTVPEWFPYSGGSVVELDIVEVAGSATATLKSQQEVIASIQITLFEIEAFLLKRLESRRSGALHSSTNAFFDRILQPGEAATEFLAAASRRHGLQTADGFRAVASPQGKELLGRIVAKIGELAPSQLPALGEAFFTALGLSGAETGAIPEPLLAVVLRSTIKELESERARRCGRNVLLVLYSSSQAITAAAHAGEYGEFNVLAMRSLLRELRAVLNAFKSVLS